MEIFKKIKGYEDLYEISNYGNVKSLPKYKCKISKILKPSLRGNYLFVRLTKNKIVKSYSVHRLVAEAFVSNPKNKPEVNHLDGNKLNNHSSNLEWCTSSENQQHAYNTGLQKKPKHLKKIYSDKRDKSNDWFKKELGNRFIRFEFEYIKDTKNKRKFMVFHCKGCGSVLRQRAARRSIYRTGGMCKKCAQIVRSEKQKITKKKDEDIVYSYMRI